MKIKFFVFCFLNFIICFSQTNNIVKNRSLINFETHLVPNSFDFIIQHRFGKIQQENMLDDFFGTDLGGNISFGITKPLKNNDCIDVFRFKKNKVISLGYKKLLMKESFSFPVNIAFYANCGIKTGAEPLFSENTFSSNLQTPFEYKFIHRIDYSYQIIISKNISEKFYLQINPGFVYKNLINLLTKKLDTLFFPLCLYIINILFLRL